MEVLQQLAFQRMVQHHERHMIIIVAEGATKPSSGEITEQLSRLGYAVRLEILGYLQRGGKPTASDRILGGSAGGYRSHFLLRGTYGVYLTVNGNEIGQEPYASIWQPCCKVQNDVLDLIAWLG